MDIYRNALAGDEPLMLGADPTEEYLRAQRNREYDAAMAGGASAGAGLGLAGMMAFPGPGGVVGRGISRFVGAPAMAAGAAGAGMRAMDAATRARIYHEAIRRGIDPTLIPGLLGE